MRAALVVQPLVIAMLSAAEAVAAPPAALDLAGVWAVRLDPKDAGDAGRWFEAEFADRIALPGSLARNGYGDEISVDTAWTGGIVDRSWFTDPGFARYREPGNVKVPFWLTPAKHFVGRAWYRRGVSIPESWRGKRAELFLERCHGESRVWVDGKPAGSLYTLSAPHEYDLTPHLAPGDHALTVCIDNRVKIEVGQDAHSVSDHTQTNWNGMIGRMELRARDAVRIEDLQVFPDLESRSATVRIRIANGSGKPFKGTLLLRARSGSHAPPDTFLDAAADGERAALEVAYPLGDGALLWDEFTPNVYRLTAFLDGGGGVTDEAAVDFGLRTIATRGTQFVMNDRPYFVRGTLECCIFPLTGYPPTDVASWRRILERARAHGLNHLRFHSWCPPDAAFAAADALGFTYHIECAAWTTVGDGGPFDAFIYEESARILKAYGNHPSFCFMAYGNEPGGKNQQRFLGDLVNSWKRSDPRRLYTSAAGWPLIPENQFHSTPEPRIHAWGSGLSCRLNAKPPETTTDYRDFVKRFEVPVISHEIGQWCVFPNLKEIDKYTGVLRARNFEIFRDSLAENGMLDQSEAFLMASGKLQALCYKEEIESALRTPGFGGFQLLDLHDFPGQGTALVGVLDAFWDSKGYIAPEEYRRFAGETVPLARMAKRVWTSGETFAAEIEIAHFGPAPMERATPRWRLAGAGDRIVAEGRLAVSTIPLGNGFRLGKVEARLPDGEARKLTLEVSLEGTPYRNDWDIWVYPASGGAPIDAPPGVFIAERIDAEPIAHLAAGGTVLLMPAPGTVRGDRSGKVPPGFTTIFWNTAWTRRQAPHTLGILCDPKHSALAGFPTEYHSNWQWWDLATKSQVMILDGLPARLRPIVQVIDDWFTNRRLALVFEARAGGGKVLVCGIDLRSDIARRPAARQLLRSLLRYAGSPAFAPRVDLDIATLRSL